MPMHTIANTNQSGYLLKYLGQRMWPDAPDFRQTLSPRKVVESGNAFGSFLAKNAVKQVGEHTHAD